MQIRTKINERTSRSASRATRRGDRAGDGQPGTRRYKALRIALISALATGALSVVIPSGIAHANSTCHWLTPIDSQWNIWGHECIERSDGYVRGSFVVENHSNYGQDASVQIDLTYPNYSYWGKKSCQFVAIQPGSTKWCVTNWYWVGSNWTMSRNIVNVGYESKTMYSAWI